MMPDTAEMQTKAMEARKARHDAVRVYRDGFPYASDGDLRAALALLPSRSARFGRVECEAITPENRTTYRRRHNRFVWRVDGKRASVEAAAAALAQSV